MQKKGLSEDAIFGELPDDAEAWVITEEDSESFLVVPDQRDGMHVVQFFMKREDAEEYAATVKEQSRHLKDKNLNLGVVRLKDTLRMLEKEQPPVAAIVNSPNGMYEFFRDIDE